MNITYHSKIPLYIRWTVSDWEIREMYSDLNINKRQQFNENCESIQKINRWRNSFPEYLFVAADNIIIILCDRLFHKFCAKIVAYSQITAIIT